MRWLIGFTFSLLATYRAWAHEGGAIPADAWTHWNTDPLLLVGLLLPAYVYQLGMRTYPINRWRSAAFFTGLVLLFIALISPLEAVSRSLFSAHMVQHLLLIMGAAPLLVLSRPTPILLRGLPAKWRKTSGGMHHRLSGLWQRLTQPVTALMMHIAAVLLWHVPGLYTAAVQDVNMHILEHISFFGTAICFWWMLRYTADYGLRVLAVFAVMMSSGLLGALMALSNTAWYSDHAAYVGAWGLTPLEDQQLAGLFMWIPAGVVYVVTAALLLGAWISAVERKMAERERQLVRETSDA